MQSVNLYLMDNYDSRNVLSCKWRVTKNKKIAPWLYFVLQHVILAVVVLSVWKKIQRLHISCYLLLISLVLRSILFFFQTAVIGREVTDAGNDFLRTVACYSSLWGPYKCWVNRQLYKRREKPYSFTAYRKSMLFGFTPVST